MIEPTAPDYAEYLQRIFTAAQDVASHPRPDSPHAGAPAEVADAAEAAIEAMREDLVGLSHDIHAHPELCYEEHYSAAAVEAFVADRGHAVTRPAWGLDTALLAEAGAADGPTVAILAEYDALPDIGHGCGHNVICATAVGAFLGAAAVVERTGGRVQLIGILETLAAVAIVWPLATRTLTWLSPVACVCLAILMGCAAYFHTRRGETELAGLCVLLGILAIVVPIGVLM